MSARPLHELVADALFQPGQRVRVVRLIGGDLDPRGVLGAEGLVKALIYGVHGSGTRYTAELLDVLLDDGENPCFWAEELAAC